MAQQNKTLFAEMLARLNDLQRTVYSPDRGSKDMAACTAATSRYGGYWGPWVGKEGVTTEEMRLVV